MHFFRTLFTASGAILFLILFLHLPTNNAQETNEAIHIDLIMPDTAKVGNEVEVKLHLETDLNECMVVKAQLRSTAPVDTSFTVIQRACLCPDYPRNLYWDFTASESMYVIAYVDAVPETGICPDDRAVVPIWGASNSEIQIITVTQ